MYLNKIDGKEYGSIQAIRVREAEPKEDGTTHYLPNNPTVEYLNGIGYFEIQETEPPTHTATQYANKDGAIVSADGTPIRKWVIVDIFSDYTDDAGAVITKAEQEAKYLNEQLKVQKEAKIVELDNLCEKQIIGGFVSNALGTPHWYKSELTDQLNLIGAVATNADTHFKAGVEDSNGVITWSWELHTAGKLKTVLDDGAMVKLQLLQKLTLLKAQIAGATTSAEVDAIVW